MNLFIRNGWLPGVGPVHIHIINERIQDIGINLSPPAEAQLLDAQNMAVVPGLVNGHSHAPMTLFRGFGDDMPLAQWLKTRIWPAEARMTEEEAYWGTRLACWEMIRSGTVAFEDMYWHFHSVARAVEESGLRAGIGISMIDIDGEQQAHECKQLAQKVVAEATRYSNRIHPSLSPHAIYTVSPASLRWCADFSAQHNLNVHIHLAETQQEVRDCLRLHGVRPALHLDHQGLLTPRTLLAHGVWLDDDELDLIALRGATLITNPTSNMKLAVRGVFPYPKVARRAIPMALGTDGAASNNSLDLFQELKTFALIQKHANEDPSTLPALAAWEIATGAKAPIFGQSGRIAPGENADLLLIRRDLPEMTPEHNFISNLVYSATGHVVDTVIVAGKILMQNRIIPGEAEMRQELLAKTAQLNDFCKMEPTHGTGCF